MGFLVLTAVTWSIDMPFIRMTATKWRLDNESKEFIGALLVYMRNEFRAGVSAVSYAVPSSKSDSIEGSAINYKRMMQCIDRILSRLDGNWDAHKLTLAYGMIARAIDKSDGGHIAKHITNEAENAYGTLALDSCWNRIDSPRDALLDETQQPLSIESGSSGEIGRPCDTENVDARPGGSPVDSSDSGGATSDN